MRGAVVVFFSILQSGRVERSTKEVKSWKRTECADLIIFFKKVIEEINDERTIE